MEKNKEKCRRLKEIRRQTAEQLEIDLHQTECTYEGKCSGTCPKCRQEEERLNKALLGKAAVALGVCLSLTACTPTSGEEVGELDGDVTMITEEVCTEETTIEESDSEEGFELEGEVELIE